MNNRLISNNLYDERLNTVVSNNGRIISFEKKKPKSFNTGR